MYRVFGNQCAQCRADIIAPVWSEHLSDYCIRHVWSCDACGYQFEDTVHLFKDREGGRCVGGVEQMLVGTLVVTALVVIALGGLYSAWRYH